MNLYHYTCDHGATGIQRDRLIKPNPHPFLGATLAWFTDLDTPWADALGLTSNYIQCDRTRHKFTVPFGEPIIWYPLAIRRLGLTAQREALEAAPGAAPAHWYVSAEAVAVTT